MARRLGLISCWLLGQNYSQVSKPGRSKCLMADYEDKRMSRCYKYKIPLFKYLLPYYETIVI